MSRKRSGNLTPKYEIAADILLEGIQNLFVQSFVFIYARL